MIMGTIGASTIFVQSHSPTAVAAQAPIVVSEEQAVIAAVGKARPAVVSIVAKKQVTVSQPNVFVFPNDFLNDPFFRQQPPSGTPPRQELRQVGSGTGFIVDANGLIITNKHVAGDRSASYEVFLNDGRSFPGTIAALDPANDIAVLRITAKSLPVVALGNSDSIVIGQTAVAIGNSLGRYQNTVTRGVVSGTGRTVVAAGATGEREELSDIIQTDAAINPGNSGGPLVNTKGEAIGMNTAVDLSGQSIGFAIPINAVKDMVTSVQKTGTIQRPWLGIRFTMVTPQIQRQFNLTVKQGALLVPGAGTSELAVIETSPAFQAGLREGDVIQKMDNETITTSTQIQRILNRHKIGDTLRLQVVRADKTLTVEVKLGPTPSS